MKRRARSSLFFALTMLFGCSSTPQTPANETPAASPTEAPTAAATQAAPAQTAAPKIDPKTTDDCKQVAATSTGDDPAAAAAAQGTGTSDRRDAITALIKQKRPGFRCCFDIWASKIPEAKLYVKVAMVLELDKKGALTSATAQPVDGGPMVPGEVEACIKDVAGSLTFPPSPSDKITKYTYPFDFKPKGRH